EAVDDGDPDEVLAGWFDSIVGELATARLGAPPLPPSASETKVHRWADQVAEPDDLDGHFLLIARLESLADPSVVLPAFATDTADALGTTPHDAAMLV